MFIPNGICFNRPFSESARHLLATGPVTRETRQKRERERKKKPEGERSRRNKRAQGKRKMTSERVALAQREKEGEKKKGCFPLFNYYKLIIFFL